MGCWESIVVVVSGIIFQLSSSKFGGLWDENGRDGKGGQVEGQGKTAMVMVLLKMFDTESSAKYYRETLNILFPGEWPIIDRVRGVMAFGESSRPTITLYHSRIPL